MASGMSASKNAVSSKQTDSFVHRVPMLMVPLGTKHFVLGDGLVRGGIKEGVVILHPVKVRVDVVWKQIASDSRGFFELDPGLIQLKRDSSSSFIASSSSYHVSLASLASNLATLSYKGVNGVTFTGEMWGLLKQLLEEFVTLRLIGLGSGMGTTPWKDVDGLSENESELRVKPFSSSFESYKAQSLHHESGVIPELDECR
ncbi:hypothetical protein Tco_0289376 [Tanacetum coccineum]